MTHSHYLRRLHRLNRILTPIVDLVFALAVATAMFLGIGFFYEVALPWMATLAR